MQEGGWVSPLPKPPIPAELGRGWVEPEQGHLPNRQSHRSREHTGPARIWEVRGKPAASPERPEQADETIQLY